MNKAAQRHQLTMRRSINVITRARTRKLTKNSHQDKKNGKELSEKIIRNNVNSGIQFFLGEPVSNRVRQKGRICLK
jgi:hypothetical protein